MQEIINERHRGMVQPLSRLLERGSWARRGRGCAKRELLTLLSLEGDGSQFLGL